MTESNVFYKVSEDRGLPIVTNGKRFFILDLLHGNKYLECYEVIDESGIETINSDKFTATFEMMAIKHNENLEMRYILIDEKEHQ